MYLVHILHVTHLTVSALHVTAVTKHEVRIKIKSNNIQRVHQLIIIIPTYKTLQGKEQNNLQYR